MFRSPPSPFYLLLNIFSMPKKISFTYHLMSAIFPPSTLQLFPFSFSYMSNSSSTIPNSFIPLGGGGWGGGGKKPFLNKLEISFFYIQNIFPSRLVIAFMFPMPKTLYLRGLDPSHLIAPTQARVPTILFEVFRYSLSFPLPLPSSLSLLSPSAKAEIHIYLVIS